MEAYYFHQNDKTTEVVINNIRRVLDNSHDTLSGLLEEDKFKLAKVHLVIL